MNRAGRLRLRIPSWARPAAVSYAIDGSPRKPAAGAIDGGYLSLAGLAPGAEVEVWLPERRETVTEIIAGQAYEVDWHNDTVVGINPPARFRALYGPA